MKKLFKGIAVLAATAAVGTGVAFAAGCGGTDGTYIGHYCYDNYGQVYGMVVEVTVENNIITKVVDITASYKDDAGKGKLSHTFKNDDKDVTIDNTQWHTCSAPWEEYFVNGYKGGWVGIKDADKKKDYDDKGILPKPEDCENPYTHEAVYYSWFKSDTDKWANHEAWLLQQYEGWTVSDMIDLKVFIGDNGEPYAAKDYNTEFGGSGLVISGATQGSGRIALAVQNALGKDIEIGRIK